MLEVTDNTFQAMLKASPGQLVVVDFWAPWCGPCRLLTPIIDQLAREVDEGVKIVKINVDEGQETSKMYGIRGVPTVLFFRDEKILETIVGIPKNALEVFREKIKQWRTT